MKRGLPRIVPRTVSMVFGSSGFVCARACGEIALDSANAHIAAELGSLHIAADSTYSPIRAGKNALPDA
jgi:hypothetical protein